MRRLIHPRLFLALAIMVALPAFAQDQYKAEAINNLPSGVPENIQQALEPQGTRFVDGAGKTLAEVWLAKTVDGQASPNTSMDVIYGAVAPGAFVGVLHYPDGGSDFRGQNIKSGYYTLRYDLIPQDGNHMGVSQYRDFLLLVPIAQDTDPAKPLKFEQAVKESRASTGTGHPGILSMESTDQIPSDLPAAFKDYSDDWAVAAKTQVKPAGGEAKDLPLAFVLVGKYEG